MIHLVESFGCGLAFVAGSLFGVMVALSAMCKVRAKEREEIKSENERTWQLLIANGQQITRIAEAAEKMIPPVYQYEITNNTVTK